MSGNKNENGIHAIFGGLGNLGLHMQRALLSAGKTMRVVDLPTQDVTQRLVHDGIDFVPSDISRDDLSRALRGVETVYLMVTPNVEHGTRREFEDTNVLGIKRVLDACQKAGVSKIIYVSSIAVTDHYVHSKQRNEDDPLPPIGSYKSWYDKTKRLGEELVLAADGRGSIQTCALRIGGIISGTNSYMFRRWFQGDILFTVGSARMDFISAKDVCRALIKADEKLGDPSTNGLSGKALFLTKGADQKPVRTSEMCRHLAKVLGDKKRVMVLPPQAFNHLSKAIKLKDNCNVWRTADPDDLPGVQSHQLMRVSCFEKTFDNRRVRHVLDFEPQMTWQQAIEDIAVEEYFALQDY